MAVCARFPASSLMGPWRPQDPMGSAPRVLGGHAGAGPARRRDLICPWLVDPRGILAWSVPVVSVGFQELSGAVGSGPMSGTRESGPGTSVPGSGKKSWGPQLVSNETSSASSVVIGRLMGLAAAGPAALTPNHASVLASPSAPSRLWVRSLIRSLAGPLSEHRETEAEPGP